MGYEWNKYNQTHYDHDNPPPKVVQGYKFNIFYPDLIDKTKAPTYRIEREAGRKRGQSFAEAGEEDTCLIRFTAGAPYEDIAFRIVDKEWDYSAKRERGFKSTFDKVRCILFLSLLRQAAWLQPSERSTSKEDFTNRSTWALKGILQLHFQFKRVSLLPLVTMSHVVTGVAVNSGAVANLNSRFITANEPVQQLLGKRQLRQSADFG